MHEQSQLDIKEWTYQPR